MAEKILKGINFPGLEDTYIIPLDDYAMKSELPVRGVDYWNDEDKAEIAVYVNNAVYGVIDGNIENITNSKVAYVRDYGYYQHQFLQNVDFSTATSIGNYSFYRCPALSSVNVPNTKIIGAFAFKGCQAITQINFPNAISVDNGAFNECAALSSVNIPLVQSIEAMTFRQCTSLVSIDLPVVTTIKAQAFWGSSVSSVTLRSSTVCTLEDVNAFAFTPIETGIGKIYVPANLLDAYKVAENWSAYADRFAAIA